MTETVLEEIAAEEEDYSHLVFSAVKFVNCRFWNCSFERCEFTDVIFRNLAIFPAAICRIHILTGQNTYPAREWARSLLEAYARIWYCGNVI